MIGTRSTDVGRRLDEHSDDVADRSTSRTVIPRRPATVPARHIAATKMTTARQSRRWTRPGTYHRDMATQDRSVASGGLGALFDASSATEVHTSGCALISFLAGLGAILSAPFSLTSGLAISLGLLGAILGLVGVPATSRPDVAGGALASLGLCLGLVAIALVGLRYLGVDNAFGDALLPTLQDLMERLNTQIGVR